MKFNNELYKEIIRRKDICKGQIGGCTKCPLQFSDKCLDYFKEEEKIDELIEAGFLIKEEEDMCNGSNIF